jgi:hypothetical protein
MTSSRTPPISAAVCENELKKLPMMRRVRARQ